MAAEELVKEHPEYIVGTLVPKHGQEIDSYGIDLLIFVAGGLVLPIQIKSRGKRILSKINRHKRLHPLVRYILVLRVPKVEQNEEWFAKSVAYAKRRLLKFVRRAANGLAQTFPPV